MKPAKTKKTESQPPQPESAASGQRSPVPQELVAERARALWEERGRPADQDLEIWLEAERQLGAKPVRDPIQPKMDSTEPDDALEGDLEQELDEETSGPSRRSATSL
jgi:hypothetical protein